MPYFPYSRQSKKKSHRGAITARMIANLLHIAGVDHVITLDLHATQMQGFFKCPIDNLQAEPLIARWIKHNVADWKTGVVVSKNAGGTKRVTSLADALKLDFGIVRTDRMQPAHHLQSDYAGTETPYYIAEEGGDATVKSGSDEGRTAEPSSPLQPIPDEESMPPPPPDPVPKRRPVSNVFRHSRQYRAAVDMPGSPLSKSALPGNSPEDSPSLDSLVRSRTDPPIPPSFEEELAKEFPTDEVCLVPQDFLHFVANT
jgi:ribose-phosphate pyrophosphokinase